MERAKGRAHPPIISHRISLCFPPSPPEELTDTLVLNAGGVGAFYTDFRPLNAHPEGCEWVFAGQKQWLEDGRCRWTHVLDNRGEEPVPDVADCETLEDGTELERGEMVNPRTGQVAPFEERWKNEKVAHGARVVLAIRQDDMSRNVEGIWIRVGRSVQCVARGPEQEVCAVRWLFSEESQTWSEVARFGTTDSIPRPSRVDRDTEELEKAGWKVEEAYTYQPL